MANGMTVDQLYEAFMDMDTDDPTPFAEDVFGFFGKEELGGYTQKEWAKQYGTYLPTWDPAQINLAGRERDLDFTTAMDTLQTTQAATERVYATEMDTLSTTLGKELGKGREMAGRIGLRSGSLESAVQDTIATTGSKAKDFGDRTRIAGQETKDKYNAAMVDAALDFEKTERQEKEEFYDRTMAAIMRLMDTGAFDEAVGIPIDDGIPVDCALNPNLPGCEDISLEDFNLDQVTFEMCQADPSLEGCAGMYEDMDLNLNPEDYDTCPPGWSGTYPNCINIDSGFSCTDPVCVAGLYWAQANDIPIGEMTQDLVQAIFGEGLGLWEDPQNPCYWTGDFPCTDARCTEITDENGCRQCDCPDDDGITPGDFCLGTCSGSTPYQCQDCSCVASSDDCSSGDYPDPFN